MTAITERPAEFDAAVMAYMPGLRKLARRYVPRQYREDLVVDTIMYALEKWRKFRPEGGMWLWLAWTMRGIVRNQAQWAGREKRNVPTVSMDDTIGEFTGVTTPPTQQHYAEITSALRSLNSREGDILVRRSIGDGHQEIGDAYGLSRQRVQQIEKRAREKLVA